MIHKIQVSGEAKSECHYHCMTSAADTDPCSNNVFFYVAFVHWTTGIIT